MNKEKSGREHNPSIEELFKNTYHLRSNPFIIHPCQTIKEYIDRFQAADKFINDLNILSISGIGANRIIIGDKGMGKTSLMNIYAVHARERGLKTVYVERVPNRAKEFIEILLKKTLDILVEDNPGIKQTYGRIGGTTQTTEDLYQMWTRAMDQIKNRPVIVFLDETSALPEMHYVESYFNNYIFDHLKDIIFVMGCTTATYHKIDIRMGGFIDRFPQVVNLPKFSEEDSIKCLKKKMMMERIKDKKIKDDLIPFTQKAVEHIIDLSDGVPRYLLEIAFNTLNIGASQKIRTIDVDVVDKASFMTKRSTLHNIWNSLSPAEKRVLKTVADIGDEFPLIQLATLLEKTKTGVWYPLNHLVETGLVEKIGTTKKDTTYKLTVDAEAVKELSL